MSKFVEGKYMIHDQICIVQILKKGMIKVWAFHNDRYDFLGACVVERSIGWLDRHEGVKL